MPTAGPVTLEGGCRQRQDGAERSESTSDHSLLVIIAVAAVWLVVCASFAAYHLAGIHDMLVKPFLQPSSSMKDDDDVEDEAPGRP